jgi:toxin ParE1/3/4
MYSVLFTRTAEADLQEILDYLSRVLGNRPAADNLLDQLDKRIQKVSEYPEAHPLVADTHLRERGIRVITLGNYLGLYRIHQDEQTAVILRLLHGRRDWVSLLMEDRPM